MRVLTVAGLWAATYSVVPAIGCDRTPRHQNDITKTVDSVASTKSSGSAAPPTVVSVIEGSWRPVSASPLTFGCRYEAAATWIGDAMIVVGGTKSVSPLDDGASYDPTTDKWKSIAKMPLARKSPRAVWTGTKLFLWGGESGSGKEASGSLYTPATDSWSPASASPLSGRVGHSASWVPTTRQVIVWGGKSDSGYMADGAAYDPISNTWTTLPVAPISARGYHAMVWTGSDVIVFGGSNGSPLRDGARYNVATKTWTKLVDAPSSIDPVGGRVVWGDALYVWGGVDAGGRPIAEGARFGTAWSTIVMPTSTTSEPPERSSPAVFFGKGRLFAWGGATHDPSGKDVYSNSGAAFDPIAGFWSTMPSLKAPIGRAAPYVVWTGRSAVIWGGFSRLAVSGALIDDGGVFTP